MRVINTGSVTAVLGCRQHIMDVLRNDYADATKQKLDEIYRSTSSSKVGGNAEKEVRMNFVVCGGLCLPVWREAHVH